MKRKIYFIFTEVDCNTTVAVYLRAECFFLFPDPCSTGPTTCEEKNKTMAVDHPLSFITVHYNHSIACCIKDTYLYSKKFLLV